MSTPLLTAKLHAPMAQTPLVARPRLSAQLHGAQRLTLISAPAGFGKTTLVSAWLTDLNSDKDTTTHACWLSLDSADNDPARFLRYLYAALSMAQPEIITTLAAPWQDSYSSSSAAWMTLLLNDLHRRATSTQAAVLVLDDYHTISAPIIHEAITSLIDYLPPQLHVIITTRADPPLPLARWRARGQLMELRADQLRFSPAEAADLLNAISGQALPQTAVALLSAQTEGWAVGLQLAALSLRGRDRSDARPLPDVIMDAQQHIADYFFAEVLQQQTPALQTFLLQTSVLARLHGDLCNAVTQRTDSHALLAQLERAHLFLFPLDGERRWYRYHTLFAECLRQRLSAQGNSSLALHERASRWYEQQGYTHDAIEHALAAQSWSRAALLIDPTAQELMRRGEVPTLLRWLHSLPLQLVHRRAGLALWAAWAHSLNGDGHTAESFLNALEALQKSEPTDVEEQCSQQDAQTYTGQIHIIRSMLAYKRQQPAAVITHAQQALAALPVTDMRLRALVALNLGRVHLSCGEPAAAEAALRQAQQLSQHDQHPFIQLGALSSLACLYLLQGRLREAQHTGQRALTLSAQLGTAAFAHPAQLCLAEACYERNALEAAWTHAQASLAQAELLKATEALVDGYILCARIQQAQGDDVAATEWLQRAKALAQGNHVLVSWQARCWLQQGRISLATHWAQSAEADANAPLNMTRVFTALTFARVQLAKGQGRAALALLARWSPWLATMGHVRYQLELWVLQAIAHQSERNITSASALLQQALSLAEPEGYMRLFLDEGPALQTLLADFVTSQRDVEPPLRAYAQRLLAAFPQPLTAHQPLTDWPSPLSARELEILRSVATGLSNRELARQLTVAQSTIEWHLKNIFSKLDVHSRTQAVARARELKLLD